MLAIKKSWNDIKITKTRKFLMGKELHAAIMKSLPFHDHRVSPVKSRYYASKYGNEDYASDVQCSISCVVDGKKYFETSVDRNFEEAWGTCIGFMRDKLTKVNCRLRKVDRRLVRARRETLKSFSHLERVRAPPLQDTRNETLKYKREKKELDSLRASLQLKTFKKFQTFDGL